MSFQPRPHSDVEPETQRQVTALLFRNAEFALGVHIVNAALLAWVNISVQSPKTTAVAWWGLVSITAINRYLLARWFRIARPDAAAAMAWRRRYIIATTLLSAAWGLSAPLFMWNGPDEAFLFTGLVLAGMVAGAIPLLAPVPAALRAFVGLIGAPMTAVALLKAHDPLHWAFGAMCLIFLGYVLASAKYLHRILGVSIRLGLEQAHLAENLIDTAQAIVVVLDTEGRILRFNRYMEDLSGYPLEKIQGADWFSTFTPRDDREAARIRYGAMVLESQSGAITSQILARDGRKITVEWHDKTLKDAAGTTLGLLAVGQDVTQREKLAESQRLLSAAVAQSPASIVVTDAAGRIVFVNDGFKRTTGYSEEETLDQNPRMFKSGHTPMGTYEEMWSAITGGHSWYGELLNKKKNGEFYWEAAHISPIVDAVGRTTHYLAVKEDITQRRAAEESLREREQFLATILENEPECVKVLGADGAVLQMNRAGLSMLEVDGVEEINACGLVHFVAPEHRAAFNELGRKVFAGGTGMLEFQVHGHRGTRRWLETHAAPLRDASGRVTHLLGVTRDISDRREAEERLALSLRGADLALGDWHIPSNALVFGDGWTKLLGYRPDELRPHATTLRQLLNPYDLPAARQALIHHLKGETPLLETEIRMRHKDGRWVWVLVRAMAVERALDGQALRVAGTANDITRRKEMEEELNRLATTDPLTGVANRRHFLDEVDMELARHKRFRKPAAFLMVDIDHFKRVNDTHGHATGDAVLQHLAELSRHRLRRLDLFGRLGGEEFGILLPGTDGPGALAFAELFRSHVADTPAQNGAGAIPLTVSIGVTSFDPGDAAPDSILARADVALYRAKEGGRNRVEAG